MNVIAPLRSVELAKEDCFRLGPAQIDPPSCTVTWPGEREILQARVMKVLVALARRRGEVVSHDELNLSCWDGRVVGEDAVQRCIALLRQLSRRAGGFSIETVPRVGYRLLAETESAPLRIPRRIVLVLIAGLLAVFAGVAFFALQPAATNDVIRFDAISPIGDGEARQFAEGLEGTVLDVLSTARLPTVTGASGGLFSPQPRYALRGSAETSQGRVRLQLVLDDIASRTTLWSKRIEVPQAQADGAAVRLAVAAGRSIYATRDFDLQPDYTPPPDIVARHIRGSEMFRDPQPATAQTPREIYAEAITRAPRSAVLHALLSLALSSDEDRHAARREAHEAIALEPRAAGAAYDTLYRMTRTDLPTDLIAADDQLTVGLQGAPGFSFLWMRHCRLLAGVGLTKDALPECQRALALFPIAEPILHSFARVAFAAGDPVLARQTIETAARYNPDHINTRWNRLILTAFGGEPEMARRLLADPATAPPGLDTATISELERFLRDYGRWPKEERRAIAGQLSDLARRNDDATDFVVVALAAMGELDQAFEVMRSYSSRYLVETNILFQPPTRAMRQDPRFWPLAARLGLAQFWTGRDRWPDFCGTEVPLQTCQVRAKSAIAAARSPTPMAPLRTRP